MTDTQTAPDAPAVAIERPDDDHIEIYVGGELVASAEHDEHGRSGMAAVEKTALAVDRALRAKLDQARQTIADQAGRSRFASSTPTTPTGRRSPATGSWASFAS
jgi:hypothetical protein